MEKARQEIARQFHLQAASQTFNTMRPHRIKTPYQAMFVFADVGELMGQIARIQRMEPGVIIMDKPGWTEWVLIWLLKGLQRRRMAKAKIVLDPRP